MGTQPARERRVGRRQIVAEPTAARWVVATRDDTPRRRRGRAEGPAIEPAGLLDVSVSGFRLMARTAEDLRVGATTTISIRGAEGPVVVRRITPSTREGFRLYGVELADATSPLTRLVHGELLTDRAVLDQDTWLLTVAR